MGDQVAKWDGEDNITITIEDYTLLVNGSMGSPRYTQDKLYNKVVSNHKDFIDKINGVINKEIYLLKFRHYIKAPTTLIINDRFFTFGPQFDFTNNIFDLPIIQAKKSVLFLTTDEILKFEENIDNVIKGFRGNESFPYMFILQYPDSSELGDELLSKIDCEVIEI